MKSTLFFFALVLCQGVYSQSNYVSTYLENPNIYAFQLHKLPWDESRLFQYTRDSGPNGFVYTMDEVSNNTISAVVPPLCSEIQEAPVLVEDGFLLIGATTFGKELIYFDETNSTIFDLNPGIDGSDPVIYTMEDRIFIVALDGVYKQLFEFHPTNHTIEQITSDAISVESVCAMWDDNVYYRTKYINTNSGEDEYTLVKATPNGGFYSFVDIQMINIPNSVDHFVDWRSPELFLGNLNLMAVNVAPMFSDVNSIGLMVIDANDQVSTTSLILPNYTGEYKLIQWNNTLGVYSEFHDFFYTSFDGTTFGSTPVPVNGKFVEYQVSEGDKLYLNCLYIDETREIFHFDGSFHSKHIGEHLHFLHQENEILYYTDYSQFDSSSIVLVHTDLDVVDEVMVHWSFHPPHGNSAVIYNGLFTFLFGTDGFFGDHDIFQLTGSPQAGIDELSVELDIYPNPISAGDAVFIDSNVDGIGQILTADGRVVSQLEVNIGTNAIETSLLTSGVYFISFMNHTHRVVVN